MNDIVVNLVLLFAYITLGFICNKLGLLDKNSDKYFSGFLLKLTLPAAIIASATGQNIPNKMQAFKVLGIAALVFILLPFLASLFQKATRCDDTYKLMLTYPNLGFMGFPIMEAMYGPLGLFYASLFMIVLNLSVFSYGVSVLGTENKVQFKKMINPGIISALLALVIFTFNIQLPGIITLFLSRIGSLTSPLAMITLGSTLTAVHFGNLFRDKLLYLFTVCRLVLWPVLVWFILHFFVKDPLILGVSTILFSLPVAGNVSMLCITYSGNTELAARGTCISTLLSLVTIPFYMYIFTI